MIADLKPYQEYIDSKIPWLGQFPAHWDLRRLRASVAECVTGVWGEDPNGRDDIFCVRVADFDRTNLRVTLKKKTLRAVAASSRLGRILKRGDLLLEKSGGGEFQSVGAVVVFDHDLPAVCSNFVARLSSGTGYDSFFLSFLHSTLYAHRVTVLSVKQTTGIQNLDWKSYLSETVAFPPLVEQIAIVRFLDWVNGRIDRTVRAKKRVIALLHEQKQAIIHRAVTCGLDPSVSLKTSGIPWLGEIPQRWDVSRSKYLFREVDERSPSGEETHLSMSQKLGLIPNTDIAVRRLVSESYAGAKLCRKGDLVLNRLKAHLGVFAIAPQSGLVSPDYTVLRPISQVEPLYFEAIYRSPACRIELRKRTKGIVQGFWRLYTDDFYDIRVPVPAVVEQTRIMEYLDGAVEKQNLAIARLEHEIDLLREYRIRLIADVVTGKLDVRQASTALPTEDLNADNVVRESLNDTDEVGEEFAEEGLVS